MTWAHEPGRGSYARPERERRFLVRAEPPGLQDVRRVEDRYLDDTLPCALPAQSLVEVRSSCEGGFVLDVFGGVLTGLRLAEVELDDLSADLHLPPWLGPEVTRDDRFSGGRLAGLDEAQAAGLLEEVRRRTA